MNTKHTGNGNSPGIRPDLWNRATDAWFRATGRDADLQCPECGYQLRGLTAPCGFFSCPECGTVTQRYKAIMPREPITWWHRWRMPALVVVALAAPILSIIVHPLFMFGMLAPFVSMIPWCGTGYGTGYRRWAFDLDDTPPPRKNRTSRTASPASATADRALSEALKDPPDPPR